MRMAAPRLRPVAIGRESPNGTSRTVTRVLEADSQRPHWPRGLEPEASQPARLGAQYYGHRLWLDAKYVPRRLSLRRSVERGGDTGPGLIQVGGAPPIGPRLGEPRQRSRVGLPLCLTFGDDV